jgi:hypothetical protein
MSSLTELLINEDIQGIGRFFSNRGYDLTKVSDEFGENSREFELYERYLADIAFESRTTKNYIIPQHEIGPSITKGNLDNWIREFCKENELKLPKGFSRKNKKQLLGMYHGMLETYGIQEEKAFKKSLPVEQGFKIRSYKHAQQILDTPINELALRNLIYDVTRDGDKANYLDYRGLRHQYHRIIGVAKKILKNKN